MPFEFPQLINPLEAIQLKNQLDRQRESRRQKEFEAVLKIATTMPEIFDEALGAIGGEITPQQADFARKAAQIAKKKQKESQVGEQAQRESGAQTLAQMAQAQTGRERLQEGMTPSQRAESTQQILAQSDTLTQQAAAERLKQLGQYQRDVVMAGQEGLFPQAKVNALRRSALESGAGAPEGPDYVKQANNLAAQIRINRSKGIEPTPDQQAFLDMQDRADPMVQLRRTIINSMTGGGGIGFGGGESRTPDEIRKKAKEDFKTDPSVKGFKIVKPKDEKEKKLQDQGYIILESPDGRRGPYTGK